MMMRVWCGSVYNSVIKKLLVGSCIYDVEGCGPAYSLRSEDFGKCSPAHKPILYL